MIEDEASEPVEQQFTLTDLMQADNLVPMLDPSFVNQLGGRALDEYKIDERSREGWLETYDRVMDMAMQVRKEKTFPWPGASNVKFPLLTQAAIQFQARAYPAIIAGSNLVKGRVLGPDQDGRKRERADRVAAHMTWQFFYDMPGWEEDTDKLLLRLPIVGCVFRKCWHDSVQRKNLCETVPARDFVVNYWSPGLDKAPRYTHIQRYYPYEIEEFIRSGQWATIRYDGEDGDDPDALVEIYEQHRLIDLDGDGYPEPYVVTLNKSGEVARIVACFDADGVTVSEGEDGPVVLRIKRKQYFVKYGFIPAPDGSFYDVGFGMLLDNISASIDTIINQLIDAGTLSNMQGGFLAGGIKIRGGTMRFKPGEWKTIDGPTGAPLRDSIVPLQLPGPSPVLFNMLDLLIGAAKDITSVQDILTGSQDSQTAPTTALALIEQGQKVFTAIYKRIHRSFGEEIGIVFGLNGDHLDREQYFALTDTPMQVTQEDYQDKDLDMVPVSDPTAVADMQKMAKAQVLMMHNGDPLINQTEIRKRSFEAAGIDNIPALFKVPDPQPDPKLLLDGAKMANEREETEASIRLKDAQAASALMSAAVTAAQLGLTDDAAMFAGAARKLGVEAAEYQLEDTNGPDDQGGGMGGMEDPSGDAGVPAIPEGPGDDALLGMGAGLPEGTGGADGGAVPGGDAGGFGEPGI